MKMPFPALLFSLFIVSSSLLYPQIRKIDEKDQERTERRGGFVAEQNIDIDAGINEDEILESGDAAEIMKLAMRRLTGAYVVKDLYLAREYLEKAASLGNSGAKAYMEIADRAIFEKEASENFGDWLARADGGDLKAQVAVAMAYRNGAGAERSGSEFVRRMTAAAEGGDAYAQYSLAVLSLTGLIIEKNMSDALKWSEAAAGQGMPFAFTVAGQVHKMGKDFEKAAAYFEKGAELGDPGSALALGDIYLNGLGGVEKNPEKALEYCMRSAENGSADGYFKCGLIFRDINKDRRSALKYFEAAMLMGHKGGKEEYAILREIFEVENNIEELKRRAAEGDDEASIKLAAYKINGAIVEKDSEGAKALLGPAASKGNARALTMLGKIYFLEEPRDFAKAEECFRKSVAGGDAEGAFLLSEMIYLGNAEGSREDSVNYNKMAADGGIPEAMWRMFFFLRESDPATALEYLHKAAFERHPQGASVLGGLYANGVMVEKNMDKAMHYTAVAAKEGYMEAIKNLVTFFSDKGFGEPDYPQALYWAAEASRRGDAQSSYFIACCYLFGNGVEENREYAFKALKEIAEKENLASAYSMVGNCYYKGWGTEKNDEKAYHAWKKAMEMGDWQGRVNYIVAYQDGVFVPKDLLKAISMTREWAEEGDAKSQYELAVYLDEEEPVMDKVESYAWFIVSDKNGYPEAKERMKAVGDRLSQEDTVKAEAMADETMKRLSKGK